MLGWKLFSHSLRMVLVNWPHALKISAPLIAAYVIGFLFAGEAVFMNFDPNNPETISGMALGFFLLILIATFWTVVAWHRFVLIEEYPAVLPPFHFDRILSYIFSSILLGLLVAVLGGILIGFSALIAAAVPALFLIISFAALILMIWAFYRLSPVLPAAALGTRMTMREAWDATGVLSFETLIAAAISFGFSLLLGLAAATLAAIIPPTALASSIAVNCVVTLVGASLLTTIYGVAIEKRTL